MLDRCKRHACLHGLALGHAPTPPDGRDQIWGEKCGHNFSPGSKSSICQIRAAGANRGHFRVKHASTSLVQPLRSSNARGWRSWGARLHLAQCRARRRGPCDTTPNLDLDAQSALGGSTRVATADRSHVRVVRNAYEIGPSSDVHCTLCRTPRRVLADLRPRACHCMCPFGPNSVSCRCARTQSFFDVCCLRA